MVMVHDDWSYVVVVPWDSADGRRRRYRLFLILPGSKELAHHGILQRHDPTGCFVRT